MPSNCAGSASIAVRERSLREIFLLLSCEWLDDDELALHSPKQVRPRVHALENSPRAVPASAAQPRYPSPVSPTEAIKLLSRACDSGHHAFWPCDVSVLDAVEATEESR